MSNKALAIAKTKGQRSKRLPYVQFLYLKHAYFSTKKRVEFYRMLHTLTENGVSIQSALTLVKTKFEQIRESRNPMNAIITDILYSMRTGMPFYHAIGRWIPNQEYVLIESCHQDIPKALKIVTQHAEHTLSIRSALVGALTYPSMMLFLLIMALVMLSFYIIPNMVKLIPVAKWPPFSYDLYLLANFIAQNYVLLACAIIAGLIFVGWSLANLPASFFRNLLDKLPPWNIYKSYTATAFLVALSSSIKLGSSFNSAILQLEPVSSPYLRKYLLTIKKKLMSGSGFGDAIDIGIFNSITLVNLSVFAITNKLEQGIQYIADNNLEEQKRIISRRGKMLGYGMMTFVAIMIGWIVLAMYGMQSAISV